MTAKVGVSAFHSDNSKKIEKITKQIIKETVSKWGSKWDLKFRVPLDLFYPDNDIAYNSKGGSTTLNPDGGVLFYEDKPIAITEVKYQTAKANACERVFRYFPFLRAVNIPLDRFIVVLDGPAFEKNEKGHIPSQPGATVLGLRGTSLFVTPDKKSFAKNLRERLLKIKEEVEL